MRSLALNFSQLFLIRMYGKPYDVVGITLHRFRGFLAAFVSALALTLAPLTKHNLLANTTMLGSVKS